MPLSLVSLLLPALWLLAAHAHGGDRQSNAPLASDPVAVEQGLTLNIFGNMALVGEPVLSTTLPTFAFSHTSQTPFSVELLGTVTFPRDSSAVQIDCTFFNTTAAFVWINDFLVCQDQHVYQPPTASDNNPIPVVAGQAYSVRAHVYYRPLLTCTPDLPLEKSGEDSRGGSALASDLCYDDTNHDCKFFMADRRNDLTRNICATLCSQHGTKYAGGETGDECWCGSSLSSCSPVPLAQCNTTCYGNRSETCGAAWRLQPFTYSCVEEQSESPVLVNVQWSIFNTTQPAPFPQDWLSTGMLEGEQERRELQSSLAVGWNTWISHDILTLALLPQSLKFTIELCTKDETACVLSTAIEGSAAVRVGAHAIDNSYAQFYVFGGPQGVGANVSIEWSATPELALTVAAVTCKGSCDDYVVRIRPGFAWLRKGNSTLAPSSISLVPVGLNGTTLYTTTAGTPSLGALVFPLSSGPIGVSSTPQDLASIIATIAQARANEYAQYAKYGDLAGVKEAVQASVAWNLVYVPVEYGPVLPVSRSWNFAPDAISPEWDYVIFDWDNLFASYIAAIDAHASPAAHNVAVSNLIQTVKSRTVSGFVPNFYAAGRGSQDRSEPPVGAYILLQLYNRFSDVWLVRYLFQDLVAWNDWYFTNRRCPGSSNLTCLGSWNPQVQYNKGQGDPGNDMQDARYESGLDNSPMYDGNFFDRVSHRMLLWDVGMTSMVINEADALAALAGVVGDTAVAARMHARAESMRAELAGLWDEETGMFVNMFASNRSFYRRISPTSFYALLARAATDEQAASMVQNWLLSPKHFCVAPQGDFSGNTDDCFWGLPSIEASDPAFPPLGYWRGYVWGPMAQLTYWSLKNYKHVPVVQEGAAALAKQMSTLMMSQWNMNRHICENFNPHKNATDCSGTRFYHWGALAGLIELLEAGV